MADFSSFGTGMTAERGNWSGSPWKWKLEMFWGVTSVNSTRAALAVTLVALRLEHHRAVGVGGSDIRVAVGQSLNQPGCLDIHEDRPVIRGAAGLQHTHHAQLDRVRAGNVEDVLRVRHEPVTGREFQRGRGVGAEDAVAQFQQLLAAREPEPTEGEVIQGGADDRGVAGGVAHIKGYGSGVAGGANGLGVRHAQQARDVAAEVERVQHEVEAAAEAASHQRGADGALEQAGLVASSPGR